MKYKRPVNIDTALRIYYTYPEIGNAEIKELFGPIGSRTVVRYKEIVREEQAKRGVKTAQQFTINTEVAYELWGIDIKDLERRRNKLKQLGLPA